MKVGKRRRGGHQEPRVTEDNIAAWQRRFLWVRGERRLGYCSDLGDSGHEQRQEGLQRYGSGAGEASR
eukprot:10001193-Alexandrium_andersonii.AAC.1